MYHWREGEEGREEGRGGGKGRREGEEGRGGGKGGGKGRSGRCEEE